MIFYTKYFNYEFHLNFGVNKFKSQQKVASKKILGWKNVIVKTFIPFLHVVYEDDCSCSCDRLNTKFTPSLVLSQRIAPH